MFYDGEEDESCSIGGWVGGIRVGRSEKKVSSGL